jgi:hypothetical protein
LCDQWFSTLRCSTPLETYRRIFSRFLEVPSPLGRGAGGRWPDDGVIRWFGLYQILNGVARCRAKIDHRTIALWAEKCWGKDGRHFSAQHFSAPKVLASETLC